MSTGIYPCSECGEATELSLWRNRIVCDSCRRELERSERESRWDRLCPAMFKTTELARLPDQAAAKRVISWEYGPNGLLLCGPTGTGKSRSIWLRLHSEVLEGRRVEAWTATQLGTHISTLFSADSEQGEKFTDKLVWKDILYIDDFDKMRATPRVASTLFDIVDRRTSGGKPILLSLNAQPGELARRFSNDNPEAGPALIRRLEEFCAVIEFRK
jgi:DNA replication protein DnaC